MNDDYDYDDVLASILEDDSPAEPPTPEMTALFEKARGLALLALFDDDDMATDVKQ